MVKTLLVRLGRSYGDGGTRSLMVAPMVRIQFKGVGMVLKGSNRWLLENVSGVYNPGILPLLLCHLCHNQLVLKMFGPQ